MGFLFPPGWVVFLGLGQKSGKFFSRGLHDLRRSVELRHLVWVSNPLNKQSEIKYGLYAHFTTTEDSDRLLGLPALRKT